MLFENSEEAFPRALNEREREREREVTLNSALVFLLLASNYYNFRTRVRDPRIRDYRPSRTEIWNKGPRGARLGTFLVPAPFGPLPSLSNLGCYRGNTGTEDTEESRAKATGKKRERWGGGGNEGTPLGLAPAALALSSSLSLLLLPVDQMFEKINMTLPAGSSSSLCCASLPPSLPLSLSLSLACVMHRHNERKRVSARG